MNKQLSLAVASGLTLFTYGQYSLADGFIEDSKADLEMRNFYINRDNRTGTASPSEQAEWGQGFILNYQSGYTSGTVGFGVDAIGILGLHLDSGKGTHYNPKSTDRGGQVFPTDSDGRAVDDFASLGPTFKTRIAQSELKIGTLRPNLPVILSNDGRMVPQTFEGTQFTSHDIDNLTFTAGKIRQAKGRNSTDNQGLSIIGANNAQTGRFVDDFRYAGADYKLTPNLTAQYYYGQLEDFYSQHFLGLLDKRALPIGSLTTDLRGFASHSNGKNSDAEGRAEGYVSSGYDNGGEIDNHLWSAMVTYGLVGHSFGLGYQRLTGKSDFPFLSMGDGVHSYVITDRSLNEFSHAGERSTVATYGYDFAKLGVPGLKFSADYIRADHVETTVGDRGEWWRGTTVEYQVQSGALHGLNVAWRNGSFRTEVPGVRGVDESKVIVSYDLDIL